MKFDIIFYLARKTALCEKALIKKLKPYMLYNESKSAVTPEGLGQCLLDSLSKCYICFILGGIGLEGGTGAEHILFGAISSTVTEYKTEIKKIKNKLSDRDGYLFSCNKQSIVLLPDVPSEIDEMITGILIRNLLMNINKT